MGSDNLEEFDLLGGVQAATAQALNVPTPTHVECEECGKLIPRDEWEKHRCGFEDRPGGVVRVHVLTAPEASVGHNREALLLRALTLRAEIDERLDEIERIARIIAEMPDETGNGGDA